MERLARERLDTRRGRGLKDRPRCERCGRPVKISSDDYSGEEILCAYCAFEAKADDYDDQERF